MKLAYLDTAMLHRLVVAGIDWEEWSRSVLGDEDWKLCVSGVHVLESLKWEEDSVFEARLDYFVAGEEKGQLCWVAFPTLLMRKELLHIVHLLDSINSFNSSRPPTPSWPGNQVNAKSTSCCGRFLPNTIGRSQTIPCDTVLVSELRGTIKEYEGMNTDTMPKIIPGPHHSQPYLLTPG